jgi:hypothetical protein
MIASLALAAGIFIPNCEWKAPRGADAFMLPVPSAVDTYRDIPAATRAKLKARMEKRQFDEFATIGKDSIQGEYQYDDLREMHFGRGTVCTTVTRRTWTPADTERGLVYCEDGHCLIVPTVCRNVSRVTRRERAGTTLALPSIESVGGFEPELPSQRLELAFVDPPPVLPPALVAIPDLEWSPTPPEPLGWPWSVPWSVPWSWESPRPLLYPFATVPTTFTVGDVPAAVVPEPGTLALMFGGLFLVGWMARRRDPV